MDLLRVADLVRVPDFEFLFSSILLQSLLSRHILLSYQAAQKFTSEQQKSEYGILK
jgi:hypothetical protein